jgi:hypothetical protein
MLLNNVSLISLKDILRSLITSSGHFQLWYAISTSPGARNKLNKPRFVHSRKIYISNAVAIPEIIEGLKKGTSFL